ncbi:MAG: hypothetical protein LBR89_03435 [Holosporales bacterium]|jgi:hypothetical protein|nr:hypothetical protein [Holosporales bacterium]
MLHAIHCPILLSVLCVQSCGASIFGVPPMPDVNSGNAQKPSRKIFSKEEDEQLRELVARHGTNGRNCWEQIARGMENRNARQCKERWCNYLSPQLDHVPWTPELDARLRELVQELGTHQWAQIGRALGGRSENDVKTHFHKLSRLNFRPVQQQSVPVIPQQNPDSWDSVGGFFHFDDNHLFFGITYDSSLGQQLSRWRFSPVQQQSVPVIPQQNPDTWASVGGFFHFNDNHLFFGAAYDFFLGQPS